MSGKATGERLTARDSRRNNEPTREREDGDGVGGQDRVEADNVGSMLQRERELMDDDFV